ncbi:MAG: GNAT family N-acetyltransferase [Acidimicrobiales bacterium]
MTDVIVRSMDPAELDAVAELWWHSLNDSTSWLRPDQKHNKVDSQNFFRKVVAQRCELWVADRDGTLVGVLALQGDELDRLYIATEAQGQGVGSALLAHAKALSPDGLMLVTLERNTQARRFYEHHGFEAYAVGRSPAPEDEPDIWYRWPPQ